MFNLVILRAKHIVIQDQQLEDYYLIPVTWPCRAFNSVTYQ